MEMHILAYFYNWSREAVWRTPRNERKMWVRLIQEQKIREDGKDPKEVLDD